MPPRKTEDLNRATRADSQIYRSYTYKKTERSHEENQERAYVAASRRSDRSIEARIQSARQASEIHKKRTGRALHITEEIVRNEEMYEEEDDNFPRSFRMLNPKLQAPDGTDSNNVASRAEAYLITRQEMSRMVCQNQAAWINENAVNKAFANAFPNHTAVQRTPSMSTEQTSIFQSAPTPGAFNPSPYMQNIPSPYASADQYTQSAQSSFRHVNYAAPSGHHSRAQSFSAPSPAAQQPDTPASGALTPAHTPTLSSTAEEPPTPAQESFLYSYETSGGLFGSSATPFDQASSAFTTTMPNDARMLMGDPMSWDNSNEQNTYGSAAGYPSLASAFNSMESMDGQDDSSAYPDLPASQSQDFGGDDMFSNFIDPEGWEKSFGGNNADAFFDANQNFDANQDNTHN